MAKKDPRNKRVPNVDGESEIVENSGVDDSLDTDEFNKRPRDGEADSYDNPRDRLED